MARSPSVGISPAGDRARRRRLALLVAVALASASGCRKEDKAPKASASASASAGPKLLSPELSAKVLAKVGDRTITLGEYAATLERMDPFERLRYQSPERRKKLLDEMIEVELLAQEARRRGLDKDPETQARLSQLLRDELMHELRRDLPAPDELREQEVRAYYDAHRDEFNEPERRRVAAVRVASAELAARVLASAKGASAEVWGKLVQEHGKKKARPGPPPPLELAGDLGIVGPPGDARSKNPRVPEPVREAAFKLKNIGDVFDEVVKDDDQYYVVRLSGKTDARSRSYHDAERSIRVAVVQARIRERESSLEKELRQKFKVSIDDAAIKALAVPSKSPAKAAP